MNLRGLYLTNRLFWALGILTALFALGFVLEFLFPLAQGLLFIVVLMLIVDFLLLYNPSVQVRAVRSFNPIFSLGDENQVRLTLYNGYNLPLRCVVVDEVPVQLQQRDFEISIHLKPNERKRLNYPVRPVSRGSYMFGDINIFIHSRIGLVNRRITIPAQKEAKVYPSIIQMKNFELMAMARLAHYTGGIKKIRRIGHSYEFESIKNYVQGDDYRSINWKATGRKGNLMVNQYEDERAQQVYCIIDKSRSMKLAFYGLSLLDHSINTSLVISNIALKKHDRSGLITFAEKIDDLLPAEKKANRLRQILEMLYNQGGTREEANYELLYMNVKKLVRQRSLLFLFTNFESMYSLERVLPILRQMNKLHLLVVVFFENTEISDYVQGNPEEIEEIYNHTIARKFILEKQQMVQTLRQYGIQAILTRPEELSMNTVNKYLELKARGLI